MPDQIYRAYESELTSIADAIRQKGGTSADLTYPNGFVSAIQNIQTGTDTSDATLNSNSQMLSGVTAYSQGTKYTGNIPSKSSSDLTASGATVTVPAGHYASQATKSVSSGSASAPSSISGTSATVSTGTNSITLTKTVSVTPSVTAGYISSGTATNSSVSLTGSVTTKAAATITPSTSNQTIASGTYLTGTQTISGDANLVAGNIKNGTTIFGVTGTYSGGGGGIGTLLSTTSLGTLSTTNTSATDTGKSLSVSSVGDYDLLVIDICVDSITNGRHISTVSMIYLTGTSNVTTKNTVAVGSNKWNIKAGSTGTKSTRQSTTAYGIYAYSGTLSSGNITIPLYYRYNSNNTGTINGSYTARVYGVKLVDLIGG